jgi:hypothetical protein
MRQGMVLGHSKQNVDVIAHAANRFSWRVKVVEYRCQVSVHPFAEGAQEQRLALLGGENEVNV